MKHIHRTGVYAKVETSRAEGIGGGGTGAEGGEYRGGEAMVANAPLPNFPTTVRAFPTPKSDLIPLFLADDIANLTLLV